MNEQLTDAERLRILSLHEAGHAVIARLLGVPVHSVQSADPNLGACQVDFDVIALRQPLTDEPAEKVDEADWTGETLVRNQLAIRYAGAAAEEEDGSRQEQEQIVVRFAAADVGQVQIEAEWIATAAVPAGQIPHTEQSRARHFVCLAWPAIFRLAEGLRLRGPLAGADVDEVIDAEL